MVFNPDYPDGTPGEGGDWFSRNFAKIVEYTLFGIAITLVIAYFIWRLLRYKGKYRKAKKEIENMEKQINEMHMLREDHENAEGITMETDFNHEKL